MRVSQTHLPWRRTGSAGFDLPSALFFRAARARRRPVVLSRAERGDEALEQDANEGQATAIGGETVLVEPLRLGSYAGMSRALAGSPRSLGVSCRGVRGTCEAPSRCCFGAIGVGCLQMLLELLSRET
jgi:hypothetical protein